jgi:PTH1 family peptidyl-tRNA hydrolase
LGGEKVARLRIGVGLRGSADAADHVLSDFRPGERATIDDALIRATQACDEWVRNGVETAMNRFNRNHEKSGEG